MSKRLTAREIAVLNASREVRDALDALAAAPRIATIEALRDGYMIDGFRCRMTLGSVVLIETVSQHDLGGDEFDAIDTALMLACVADELRNDLISVADDAHETRLFARRLARGFSKRRLREISLLIKAWHARAMDVLQPAPIAETDDGMSAKTRRDWWCDTLDRLASEYGWSDEEILWRVPITRAFLLTETIGARRSGKPIDEAVGADVNARLRALEVAEHTIENLRKKSDGTSTS